MHNMNDYDKIRNMIVKKGYPSFNKEPRDYFLLGYAVYTNNEISINVHIDLEVARTTFKFNDNGELLDVETWGWY